MLLIDLLDDKIVVRVKKLLETYLRGCNHDVHVAALRAAVRHSSMPPGTLEREGAPSDADHPISAR